MGEEGRDVGEEVEGVAEEHRLKSGDCPHLRPIREDLGFLSDCSGVADGKTVEGHEEHKAEEEAVSKGSEVAVKIDGDVAELELANEHRGGLDQGGSGLVEEDIDPNFVPNYHLDTKFGL